MKHKSLVGSTNKMSKLTVLYIHTYQLYTSETACVLESKHENIQKVATYKYEHEALRFMKKTNAFIFATSRWVFLSSHTALLPL